MHYRFSGDVFWFNESAYITFRHVNDPQEDFMHYELSSDGDDVYYAPFNCRIYGLFHASR